MIDPKAIFSPKNRGILLDVVVFLTSAFLMSMLSARLNGIIKLTQTGGNVVADGSMLLYTAALCILPGAAALLKYLSGLRRNTPDGYRDSWGSFFGNAVTVILIGQFLGQLLFFISQISVGSDLVDLSLANGISRIPLRAIMWLSILTVIAAPVFARLYFFGTKPLPTPERLRIPFQIAADVLLYLNMILYQAFWGILMTDVTKDYPSVAARLSTVAFASVLIYFPPRLFYLADDAHRPITWLTIILANSPLLIRIFFS